MGLPSYQRPAGFANPAGARARRGWRWCGILFSGWTLEGADANGEEIKLMGQTRDVVRRTRG